MRISAKADYAVRAALELAASEDGAPVKGTKLAEAQKIPLQFLEQIMLELKRAGLVRTKRGANGGYWLAMDAGKVTVADVIRAVEGPLANIHDIPPEETSYPGPARRLRDVWIAVRVNLRAVLEEVTLEDLKSGRLPESVAELIDEPGAWKGRDTGTIDAIRP
jgi:Rrf2 family protein